VKVSSLPSRCNERSSRGKKKKKKGEKGGGRKSRLNGPTALGRKPGGSAHLPSLGLVGRFQREKKGGKKTRFFVRSFSKKGRKCHHRAAAILRSMRDGKKGGGKRCANGLELWSLSAQGGIRNSATHPLAARVRGKKKKKKKKGGRRLLA